MKRDENFSDVTQDTGREKERERKREKWETKIQFYFVFHTKILFETIFHPFHLSLPLSLTFLTLRSTMIPLKERKREREK